MLSLQKQEDRMKLKDKFVSGDVPFIQCNAIFAMSHIRY